MLGRPFAVLRREASLAAVHNIHWIFGRWLDHLHDGLDLFGLLFSNLLSVAASLRLLNALIILLFFLAKNRIIRRIPISLCINNNLFLLVDIYFSLLLFVFGGLLGLLPITFLELLFVRTLHIN